jgi:hypothetical protein
MGRGWGVGRGLGVGADLAVAPGLAVVLVRCAMTRTAQNKHAAIVDTVARLIAPSSYHLIISA